MAFSRTQVDRLGERVRRGDASDDDLRLLDAYRREFTDPHATVVAVLRNELDLAPTGRPAKSTTSIVDKLRRETARLSQVQDIAGCRVVVSDVGEQDRTVQAVRERFGDVAVVDRRARPSNGYRAVHLLVPVGDHRVEIQVRTALQQLWAELSEKLSDRFGIAVKYGGGAPAIRVLLDEMSELVAVAERLWRQIEESLSNPVLAPDVVALSPELTAEVARLRVVRQLQFEETRALLQRALATFTAPEA